MNEFNRILTIPRPGEVDVVCRPYPKIIPGYAMVRMKIAPVCIEHRIYHDFKFEWHEDPFHLGHEGVGDVCEVTRGSRFTVGDRVIVYQANPCGMCYVCTSGLSPTHCMRHPYEEMEAGATLPGLGDTTLGNPTMEALGSRGVGKRAIELTCGSESGGFGFGRFRIAPEIMIQKIPDELEFRYAAAANCACGCTYTGIEELGVRRGDFVLVAGIGFIGLGAIINAKYRGATVIALGRNAQRMEMARRIGADHVLDPEDPQWLQRVREITGYRQGVDYAAECSGYPYYQSKCIAAVRRYGGVYFFGHVPGSQHKLELHVLDEVMNRHVHLTGGHDVRWIDRQGLVDMLQVKDVQRQIDVMVTHEFNMSEGKAAFEAALSKKAGKIYLYPWEDCPA